MKNAVYFLSCFTLFLLVVGCNKKTTTEPAKKEFLNTLWTLELFNVGGNVIKPQNEQIYNVQFKEDGTFTGINDCNDFGGKYEFKTENSIVILKVGGSKVNCPDSMFLEYLEAFRTAKSYKIHKNKLYIYYGDNSKLIFYGE